MPFINYNQTRKEREEEIICLKMKFLSFASEYCSVEAKRITPVSMHAVCCRSYNSLSVCGIHSSSSSSSSSSPLWLFLPFIPQRIDYFGGCDAWLSNLLWSLSASAEQFFLHSFRFTFRSPHLAKCIIYSHSCVRDKNVFRNFFLKKKIFVWAKLVYLLLGAFTFCFIFISGQHADDTKVMNLLYDHFDCFL